MNARSFNKLMAGRSSRAGFQTDQLGEEDMIIFRMFKAKPTTSAFKDNQSYAESLDNDSFDNLSLDVPLHDEDGDFRWQEKYRIRLFYVNIISASHKSCRIKLGVGSDTKIKTITFDSKADLESFRNVCLAVKGLQKERADRLAAELKEKNPNYSNMTASMKSQESMGYSYRGASVKSQESIGYSNRGASVQSQESNGYSNRGASMKSQESMGDDESDSSDLLQRSRKMQDPGEEEDDESLVLVSPRKNLKTLKASALKSLRSAPKVSVHTVREIGAKSTAKIKNVIKRGSKNKTNEEEDEDTIDLLVEIVSACNLPAADKRSKKSDPYVRILDGNKVLHKTRHITKTLNPVWTLSQGCFFLYRAGVEEYFETGDLVFEVRDWDAVGKDTTLGIVALDKQSIMKQKGARKEYEINLTSEFSAPNDEPVMLALRFREATEEDINFMSEYARKRKGKAVYSDDTFIPPKVHKEVKILKQLHHSKEKHGTTKVRVKPGPDPDPNREEATKWMNYFEIESEVVEPSKEWIEAGSGRHGRLYVEVLSCDDLPNLDFSITGLDKTDPFVCLVFEDAIGHTDVLDDLLSPRWMPWTQRAFAFNIDHPNSQVSQNVCYSGSCLSFTFHFYPYLCSYMLECLITTRQILIMMSLDVARSTFRIFTLAQFTL